MLKLLKDKEFNEGDLILGLGYNFWLNSVSTHEIKDIEYCFQIIQYFQNYLGDLLPKGFSQNESNQQDKRGLPIDEEELILHVDVIILIIGIKFWQKTVQYQNIVELKHCNIVIGYLQTCLRTFFENSEMKSENIKNDFDYVIKDETPDKVSDVDNEDVEDKDDVDYNDDSDPDEEIDSDEDYVGQSISIPIKKKNLNEINSQELVDKKKAILERKLNILAAGRRPKKKIRKSGKIKYEDYVVRDYTGGA